MTEAQAAFVLRVLQAFAFDFCDELFFRTDAAYAPVAFFVNCNDFFWWGCGDAEEVTPENIAVFEQAKRDAEAIECRWEAPHLFCARVRKLRPQGCCYPKESAAIALYDACGPKREIDLGNPYAHPHDGGKYEYTKAMDRASLGSDRGDPVDGA